MGNNDSTIRRAARILGCFAFVAIFLPCPVSDAEDVPASAAAKKPAGDKSEEDPATAAAELAPIVVDADRQKDAPLVERTFETAEDVTGFGETIFAEPIWRGFETTGELLGQSVGAQLLRQGGRDDFATLTLRGAPSAQLRILLDGIALGRASQSVVNLADLPLDTVERIDVYRGFAPVALSASSAAGVVNIITRDPTHATASAAAGGGSFGSAKVNASGAGPVAGGSASAFVSYRRTDGDFDYVDDNGTIFKREDDFVQKRRNNDSDAVENLLRWRRGITDTARLQLRNHVFYKEEGVPGVARCGPDVCFGPAARLETVREIAAAAIGSEDNRWSIEEGVTSQIEKLDGFGSIDNTADTIASSTTARWGSAVGKANWFSGSGDFTWEGFDQRSDNVSPLPGQHAERDTLALAAGDEWTIAELDTTVSMQLRYQQLWNSSAGSSDSVGSTDPRLGLRWKPVEGFAIKANASSYFRPPSFDELYGADGFTIGNPLLQPEEGIAFDAGFEWTFERAPFGKFAAGYSWFGSEVDEIILIRLTANREGKAFNAARASIRGHEARLEWHGAAGLSASANYTFQDAEDRTSPLRIDPEAHRANDLAGLAPHEAWMRLAWTHGLFVVAADLGVTSSHFVDPENNQKIENRTVYGLQLIYGPFWKGFRLTLEGDNLGDSLVPDQIGFPLPGRAFYATLSWSLQRKEEG